MKGYPKKLKTKEDYYNCLAMVQAGELEAAGLVEALDALEERRYIPCNILQISNNRKEVTVLYCTEAEVGAEFKAGDAKGNVTTVTNVQAEQGGDEQSVTKLGLSVAVPQDVTVVKVMNSVDVLARVGMTEADIAAIREVLKNYE